MIRPLGLVLAGGRSRRFGTEKAMALLDGAPIIARPIALLRRSCAEVGVNAPEDSGAATYARSEGLAVLPDAPGHPIGPLAGVAVGLRRVQELGLKQLVTLPCDTPDLPDDLIGRLLQTPAAPAAFAETIDGPQPLCAVWSLELLPSLEAMLGEGRHGRVQDFLRDCRALALQFEDESRFANINSAADLSGFAAERRR